jgi:hypothetical protein
MKLQGQLAQLGSMCIGALVMVDETRVAVGKLVMEAIGAA